MRARPFFYILVYHDDITILSVFNEIGLFSICQRHVETLAWEENSAATLVCVRACVCLWGWLCKVCNWVCFFFWYLMSLLRCQVPMCYCTGTN